MTAELYYVLFIILGLITGVIATMLLLKSNYKSSIQNLEYQNHEQQTRLKELSQIQSQYNALKERTSQLTAQLESSIEIKEDLNQRLIKSQDQYNQISKEKNNLEILLAQQQVELTKTEEKHQESQHEIEKLNQKFSKEFENLANKILEEKSSKFTDQNKKNIEQILTPLQEKISLFEKRVENTHKENTERQVVLREQIKRLTSLNEQINKEATNLTKALKGDAKMRGNWGELVLERVLEKSGLEKGSEYDVQQSYKTEDGKTVLPDVVIHLPGNKKMIIDSKVSLIAYERYVNEENEQAQDNYLKQHIQALKKHVNDLSEKNYHELYQIESPDFVLLFIPIEPAFAMALNADDSLYSDAFNKNIVIVTPTTLLATLRTIDTMWQNEKQQKYAIEIASAAGGLYDKFVLLTEDLIKVGSQLDTVKKSYSASMNKLTDGNGNIVGRIQRLKKLGAKANKNLNEKLVQRALENDPDALDDTPNNTNKLN